jgi:mannose-6-phosphate isomerase-like protein (cupin superfamily)
VDSGTAFTRLKDDVEDRFQSLRRELGVSTFGLNLILLKPGQRGRIHKHRRQEEVYLVLEGTLTLHIEDTAHSLEAGSLARVGPEVRRQLTNETSQRLAVVAIGGAQDHQGRDGVAFASWEDAEGASPQDVPLPDDVPVES